MIPKIRSLQQHGSAHHTIKDLLEDRFPGNREKHAQVCKDSGWFVYGNDGKPKKIADLNDEEYKDFVNRPYIFYFNLSINH